QQQQLLLPFSGGVFSNPTPPPLDCSFRSDGVYWWGCRAYQVCEGGHERLISCPKGEAFHQEQQTCLPVFNVPAPCGLQLECPTGKDGAHRYPDSDNTEIPCNFFYTCVDGEFLGHQQCGEGTVFDEVNQLCNWPENVYPPCGTKTDEDEQYDNGDGTGDVGGHDYGGSWY
ncbi:uncharacterized protein LOC115231338, partial [Octopus sinensis]|uniref:Uncharacterized protein LOC115231338 n=1 Tax=Octopus sinensis TaxID=2607531 RepID=A0A6P7U4N6_9MOLL